MKIPASTAQYFVRAAREATLATHSTYLPDFPHASWVPICSDHTGCPVFLISHLAEHTKNLQASPNASLLITQQGDETTTRLTLIGTATPFDPTLDELDRFTKLLPESNAYLTLGGFRFYRFLPQALRFIAGFGQMGWLAGTTYLADCPGFSPEESRQLLTELQRTTGWTLLTLDPYGLNLSTATDTNLRVSTPSPLLAPEAFAAWSRQVLAALA